MDSNKKVMEFLEFYQCEELIWNPKHPKHKMKHMVNDAWTRISTKMNIPVNDLKLKKNSLMATFRGHMRKKKSSIKSGMAADEAYEPIWFAYQFMESFLAPIYECEGTINTENHALPIVNDEKEEQSIAGAIDTIGETSEHLDIILEPDLTIHEDESPIASINQTHPVRPVTQRQKRRQVMSDIHEAQKQIKTTFTTLNNILTESNQQKQECECDLYGKLLAKKLKYYTSTERQQIMHEIDGLLLRKPPTANVPYIASQYISSPAYTPMVHGQNSTFATASRFQTQLPNLATSTFSQSPKIIINKSIIIPKLTNVATCKPSQVLIKIPKRSSTNNNTKNN